MNLITLIAPAIIGFLIAYTAMHPNNNEPIYIKILGIIVAIIITYPILMTVCILT